MHTIYDTVYLHFLHWYFFRQLLHMLFGVLIWTQVNKRDKGGGGGSSITVGGPFIVSAFPWGRLFKLLQNSSWLAPFSLICRRQDTRAIFSKSKEQTSQPAGKNLKSYFLSKSCSFLIHSWGFSQRCMLGFERGGLCTVWRIQAVAYRSVQGFLTGYNQPGLKETFGLNSVRDYSQR